MSQDMNVLCCYSCKMYQVHIVKKARKWKCKLCNANQSIQKVYFQGSGKDCRLHVQNLNYLKASDTSLTKDPEQEESINCNGINVTEKLNIDTPIENKRAKYLDLPQKTNIGGSFFSTTDKVQNMATNTNSLCNGVNNDSCNSENALNNYNFKSENIANEEKNSYCADFNYHCNIPDKCNLQNSDKSTKDRNNVANIFETYGELDDPLI